MKLLVDNRWHQVLLFVFPCAWTSLPRTITVNLPTSPPFISTTPTSTKPFLFLLDALLRPTNTSYKYFI